MESLGFSTRLYKDSFYQVSSFEGRFLQQTSSEKLFLKCSALEDKPLSASAQSHTSCTQFFPLSTSAKLSSISNVLQSSVSQLVSSRVLILKCLCKLWQCPSTSLHYHSKHNSIALFFFWHSKPLYASHIYQNMISV